MRDDDLVAILQHPGDALVHDVKRAVALFVAHLADLQQNVLAAGRHRVAEVIIRRSSGFDWQLRRKRDEKTRKHGPEKRRKPICYGSAVLCAVNSTCPMTEIQKSSRTVEQSSRTDIERLNVDYTIIF